MEEGLLWSKEVAAMIGIAPLTFQQWRQYKKDVPPAYYINGRPRYRRSDVIAWIDAHAEK